MQRKAAWPGRILGSRVPPIAVPLRPIEPEEVETPSIPAIHSQATVDSHGSLSFASLECFRLSSDELFAATRALSARRWQAGTADTCSAQTQSPPSLSPTRGLAVNADTWPTHQGDSVRKTNASASSATGSSTSGTSPARRLRPSTRKRPPEKRRPKTLRPSSSSFRKSRPSSGERLTVGLTCTRWLRCCKSACRRCDHAVTSNSKGPVSRAFESSGGRI
jgi:hypothetical protein